MFSGKETDRRDMLKTAVAASFSSMYASGSMSASYEDQSRVNKQEQSTTDLSKLAWTARGGNTLLCANPPAWAGSVVNPMNWRVIEQEQVSTMHELIGKFPGYQGIPQIFETIAMRKIAKEPPRDMDSFTGRIRLVLESKDRRFWLDKSFGDGVMAVPTHASKTEKPEIIFTVLNANIHQADRKLDNVGLHIISSHERKALLTSHFSSFFPNIQSFWLPATTGLPTKPSATKYAVFGPTATTSYAARIPKSPAAASAAGRSGGPLRTPQETTSHTASTLGWTCSATWPASCGP
jgi:hypothetical protein